MSLDSVQRTVYRMQLDPAFAAAILAGDPAATATTGLGARELGWLAATDPVAWRAEPRRREQVLGNVTLEFRLSVSVGQLPVARFLGSPELHAALAEDRSLPLAFADWLARTTGPELADLVRLESEMARARRLPTAPPPGLGLAPGVRLPMLPAGLVDFAAALRAALDAKTPLPRGFRPGARVPVVLVPVPTGRWSLPEVRVEELGGAVADLALRAAAGLDTAGLAAFGAAWDATPDEVDGLIADLIADGILRR